MADTSHALTHSPAHPHALACFETTTELIHRPNRLCVCAAAVEKLGESKKRKRAEVAELRKKAKALRKTVRASVRACAGDCDDGRPLAGWLAGLSSLALLLPLVANTHNTRRR